MLFNDILSLVTLVTLVLWLLDRLWLRGRRQRQEAATGRPVRPNALLDFGAGLFPVILFVFIVRSFIIEPFRIPSGSMIPTLHIGDFILVDKFSYGLRCPVGECRLIGDGVPHRGDVVVFLYPGASPNDPNRGEDFIKRVIGVPGDHIRYVDKKLVIDGKPLKYTSDGTYDAPSGVYDRELETINGITHSILVDPARPPRDFEFTVPPGRYFMMGDNRDNSYDSRYWGTVPDKDLRGRAFLIWMNWEAAKFRPDFGRIGMVIH